MQIALDESSVKVHEAKEDLHIIDALWPWPVSNYINSVWVHPNALLAYDEAKEAKLRAYELTLLDIGIQAEVP